MAEADKSEQTTNDNNITEADNNRPGVTDDVNQTGTTTNDSEKHSTNETTEKAAAVGWGTEEPEDNREFFAAKNNRDVSEERKPPVNRTGLAEHDGRGTYSAERPERAHSSYDRRRDYVPEKRPEDPRVSYSRGHPPYDDRYGREAHPPAGGVDRYGPPPYSRGGDPHELGRKRRMYDGPDERYPSRDYYAKRLEHPPRHERDERGRYEEPYPPRDDRYRPAPRYEPGYPPYDAPVSRDPYDPRPMPREPPTSRYQRPYEDQPRVPRDTFDPRDPRDAGRYPPERRGDEYHDRYHQDRPRDYDYSRATSAERPRKPIPTNVPPSKAIGLFGLSIHATEDDIREFLEENIPDIRNYSIILIYNKITRLSKGFGFVYFDSIDDSIRARERLIGKNIKGKAIRVDFSLDDVPRNSSNPNKERDHNE